MRPLETLLLLANLLSLLVWSIPRLRAARWTRHSASVALLIAVAQVLVEGPRWQMIPAYGLTALLWLCSTLQHRATVRGLAERTRLP